MLKPDINLLVNKGLVPEPQKPVNHRVRLSRLKGNSLASVGFLDFRADAEENSERRIQMEKELTRETHN